ncbi:MAG: O-antigen ligase family protein [Bacillota bacterium]
MEILFIIGLACYALIAFLRLDWALFILLASLPVYLLRLDLGPIPSTALELMILITAFFWILKEKPWKRFRASAWKARRQKYPYSFEIVGILIAAWAGLAIAGFDNSALGIFKAYFLEPVLVYMMVVSRSKGSDRKYLWALGLSAGVISAVAIYQQLTGEFINNSFWAEISQRRVTSFFPYPNAVGLFLGPIVMMLFGLLFSYPNRTDLLRALKKLALVIIILASLAAIFFARSEGALIGIAAGTFMTMLLYNKQSRRLALAGTLAVIAVLSLYQPAWQYIEKKATLMDLSGQIRRQQWKETFQMLEEGRMISGAGLDNYQEAVSPYHQEGIFVKNDDPDWQRKVVWNDEYRKQVWQPVEIYKYPHNIFLNFWSEITLFGALLFTWLIGRFFYESIRLQKKLERDKRMIVLGLIGAMTVLVVHGLVDVPYFKNDLSILFWIIIAAFGIIKIKARKSI